MKQLVYRTIDGVNPRKKEVSIEENERTPHTHITKRWACKYFIRSRYDSSSLRELKEWVRAQRCHSNEERDCHILKETNLASGETKILCKVIGEFYVVRGLTAFRIMYVNSVKIHMTACKRGG